jgi:hypothetical protein
MTNLRQAAQQEPVAAQEKSCRTCSHRNPSLEVQGNQGACGGCRFYSHYNCATLPAAQPEPTCPECKAAVLYECVACSNNNYPPVAQPEPLEYWNAVEGWVKIDEVREHFEAVNCGTIYKHGGEGRVPLYTAPPQRCWVGLTNEEKKKIATAAGCTEDDDGHIVTEIFRLAEAKLKEKNDH